MQDKDNSTLDRALRLAWKLKDIHHLRSNLAQMSLNSIGLHFGHPRILFTIDHLEGASQKELAEHLHVTPASLATSLKRLQKAGFLARSSDDHDQRVNKIELTDRGRKAIRICKTQLFSIDQLMHAGFSVEEQEQLAGYLDRMYLNLEKTRLEDIEAACRLENEMYDSDASEVNT